MANINKHELVGEQKIMFFGQNRSVVWKNLTKLDEMENPQESEEDQITTTTNEFHTVEMIPSTTVAEDLESSPTIELRDLGSWRDRLYEITDGLKNVFQRVYNVLNWNMTTTTEIEPLHNT
ncbi:Hypothetical protein CINCED_3A025866 [Cinara cedri]|uniref:Uncharacterized protein n=1 Tax=Cinara cedri TaxID=506608 RepID=A0A5E4MTZ2_9HEMI|nr:Hypothetical protein CINCED_3A025866 [Cinara cedri]